MKYMLIPASICLLCVVLAPRFAKAQAEFFATAHAHNQSLELIGRGFFGATFAGILGPAVAGAVVQEEWFLEL